MEFKMDRITPISYPNIAVENQKIGQKFQTAVNSYENTHRTNELNELDEFDEFEDRDLDWTNDMYTGLGKNNNNKFNIDTSICNSIKNPEERQRMKRALRKHSNNMMGW